MEADVPEPQCPVYHIDQEPVEKELPQALKGAVSLVSEASGLTPDVEARGGLEKAPEPLVEGKEEADEEHVEGAVELEVPEGDPVQIVGC